MKYPKALIKLIEDFSMLPSVGKKTAERYALFIYTKMLEEDVINFSNDLVEVKKNIKICKCCGNISEEEICSICSDETRNKKQILVVETIKDLFVIENVNQYYEKIVSFIEKKEYKSPFQWYFIEQYKNIVESLNKAKFYLDKFKSVSKDKLVIRQAIGHLNFSYDHIFISKDKINAEFICQELITSAKQKKRSYENTNKIGFSC